MRLRNLAAFLSVPAFAAALLTAGCSSDNKQTPAKGSDSKPSASDSGTKSTASGDKTPFEVTPTATLKGKVTFDGEPPEPKDLTPLISQQQDKNHCLKGPTKDPLWMVNKDDKGIANVVVWLRPPEGKYFKVPADQQSRKDEQIMDQPFCAFIPHVVAINPMVYDPTTKKQKKTGQTFKVLNSAPMNHNTSAEGSKLLNPTKNEIIKPKGQLIIDARPCQNTAVDGEDLLRVNCDIHKWMSARVAVFDHPYYAVTDLNGNYEIKNAPAGAEVILAHWHESFDDSLKKAKTEPVTLKAGENIRDLKIK
jgi:hypothetical protein